MAVSRAVRPFPARPRPVDLNLLPPELRRNALGGLTALLALGIVLGSVLAVAGLQFRLAVEDDAQRWSAREVRSRNSQSTLAAVENQAQELQAKIAAARQQLDVMQNDYQEIANRRIAWSQIVQALVSGSPPDLTLSSIQQKNYQLIVQGTAGSSGSVTTFADRLKNTGFFAEVAVQSITEAPGAPAPAGTNTPVSVSPTPVAPAGPPTPFPVPPTATPLQSGPTATPPAPAVTVLPPVSTPGASPTPTSLPTSPTATGLEFRVIDKIRTSIPGTTDRSSIIRGRIVDEGGNLIRGRTIQVTSCCPEQRSEVAATDGTFEFVADRRATYAAAVTGGRSETAGDLTVNVAGFTGYHIWEVTFRRVGASAGNLGGSRPLALLERDSTSELAQSGPADRPRAATFAFVIVMQVKPGAGQVPAVPSVPTVAVPGAVVTGTIVPLPGVTTTLTATLPTPGVPSPVVTTTVPTPVVITPILTTTVSVPPAPRSASTPVPGSSTSPVGPR